MRILPFLLLFLTVNLNLFGQKQIFVSPSGDDNNSGTIQKPLASINQALKIVDAFDEKDTSLQKVVEVIFRKGTYKITETIDLKSYSYSIELKAYQSERVIFTSGNQILVKELSGIKNQFVLDKLQPSVRQNVKEIDLSKLGISASEEWPDKFRGYAGWPEIYFNDKPLQISKWPNSGFAKIEKVIEKGSPSSSEGIPDSAGVFVYKEDKPSTWDNSQEIYLDGYWCFKWFDEVLKVDRIDKDKKEIHLAAYHHYKIGGPSGGLYYAINLIEELDLPGEYVFDRKKNKLYFLLPESAKKESKLEISHATNDLFSFNDSENISFEGITFCNHSGNAISINNSSNIVFRNCIFKNISRTAVNIFGGEKCGLDNCLLYNIGESGVILDGGKRETLTSSEHFATNCHVHHFARHQKTYCPAFHIKGVGQKVISNYIHDAPHNAILFWGNDHLIKKNRIERVCLNTSDAGAIYTGRDWTFGGTVIRQNYISTLGAASHHHNWGIYLDDMVAGIEVSENIIADSPSGILVGGGRSNIIKDNLIINAPMASIIFDARAIGWAKYHVEGKTSTMWERLYAMPYKESPWKDRFPYLLELENDEAAEPRNNIVSGNLYFNSVKSNLHKIVEKKGEVKDNQFRKEKLDVEFQDGQLKFSPSVEDLSKYEEVRFK